MKSFIVKLNLLFVSKLDKQVFLALIWFKNETQNNKYLITQETLTKISTIRIKDSEAKKNGGIFAATKNYPLQGHIQVIDYLVKKGFLDKSGNNWIISHTGHEKISKLEDFNSTIMRIIAFLGTIGGIVYLPEVVKFFFKLFTSDTGE